RHRQRSTGSLPPRPPVLPRPHHACSRSWTFPRGTQPHLSQKFTTAHAGTSWTRPARGGEVGCPGPLDLSRYRPADHFGTPAHPRAPVGGGFSVLLGTRAESRVVVRLRVEARKRLGKLCRQERFSQEWPCALRQPLIERFAGKARSQQHLQL